MGKITFHNKEEIEEAVMKLRELEVNEGWLLVKQIIQGDIDDLETELHDPMNKVPERELKLLKWRRYYLELLKDVPTNMMNQLSTSQPGTNDLDPYEK